MLQNTHNYKTYYAYAILRHCY